MSLKHLLAVLARPLIRVAVIKQRSNAGSALHTLVT